MIPWSAAMSSTLTLYCVLATWLVVSIDAITVSIDRSDLKPAPTQSSMIANGWRPLASSYEDTIGTNVSPSSNLERNGPLHPVLGKYQEHMATSDKQKPPRKSKPTGHHDYTPPSILGSFTVLSHAAAKSRPEQSASKYQNAETQEYTFLIPPPKNVYRFEMDQQRKPVFRENGAYPRQPQYVPQQVHQDPHRAATYYVKGYVDTTNSPNNPHNHPSGQSSSKNRPFVTSYALPQQLFQPPRHEATPFESLKISNAKPYLQPPGNEPAIEFTKGKQSEQDHRQNYDGFKPPPPPPPQNPSHGINPSGNYYSQVNHQSQRYKPSYERNPSFLVHESHEISYVTPPGVYSGFNIRPSTPYETLLPPEIYSSPATGAITSSTVATSSTTTSPRLHEPGKFVQSNELVRTDQDFKQNRPGVVKQTENLLHTSVFPGNGVPGTYYVSESQDLTPPPSSWPISPGKYTSDINEVLPRVNPPTKFTSVDAVRPQVEQQHHHQQQHYQNPVGPSVGPTGAQQQTNQPEYETPESISLKHFNEQQFLLQQQLIQRDRQRLAEQERQQQLEIEKQQREELKRRQEELKKLLEKEQEEAKIQEAALNVNNQPLVQVLPDKVMDGQTPYTIQLAQFEIPKVTIPTDPTPYVSSPSINEQPVSQYSQTIQPYSEISTNLENVNQQQQQLQQQIEYHEPEPEVRPYRPQKPSREHYRRRKPTTTIVYDVPSATDLPSQLPETLSPVTPFVEEVSSIYTTPTPETLTVPVSVTTQRPRLRPPGIPGRRRRPTTTTTTTTEESITGQNFEEDFLKYERPEHQYTQDNRRRRVRPTSSSNNPEAVTEKRPNIRKRPGHRVRINPGEPFDAEIVTEVVHAPIGSHRETITNANNYESSLEPTTPAPDKFLDYTSSNPLENHTVETNEPLRIKYEEEDVRNTASQLKYQEEGVRNTASQLKYQEEGVRNTASKLKYQEEGVRNTASQLKYQEEGLRNTASKLKYQEEGVRNTASQLKYQEENMRNTPDVYNEQDQYGNQQQSFNTDTNVPLEELFVRTDGSYVERLTTESTTSTSTTTTTTTTTPPTTQVSVSTTRSLKIRPLRYGNNTRPRFSIKDYKTRMDYKSKIAGMSTTETSVNQPAKQRQTGGSTRLQPVPQQVEQTTKDTPGRYKYVSRGNHRITTTTATPVSERDNQQTGSEDNNASTTERTSRFVPKRRPVSGNVYRSRISSNGNLRSQQSEANEAATKSSTARAENVFSSSIRRRPLMKSKLHVNRSNNPASHQQSERKGIAEVPTEMTAEETSFYSPMTTSSPRAGSNNEVETVTTEGVDSAQRGDLGNVEKWEFEKVGKSDKEETREEQSSGNENVEEVKSRVGNDQRSTESSVNVHETSTRDVANNVFESSVIESGGRLEESEVRPQESEVRSQESEVRPQKSEVRPQESEVRPQDGEVRTQETQPEIVPMTRDEQLSDKEKSGPESTSNPLPEITTRFDVRSDEEELFAKASQSVADLTSSASALYDKPGMFKAVSPESRLVASHFKIATDEPTLPIEAFFQELSRKN